MIQRVVVGLAAFMLLAACGSGEGTPDDAPGSTTTSSSIEATTPPPVTEPTEGRLSESSPVDETVAGARTGTTEPHIIDCQMGLGPVETYWSDGTVSGYSEYCQSVSDATVRAERLANTPTCDGAVCRYPSGAEFPDPNAQSPVDVPYTCNYDVLCDDAGNVIPGPGGPEIGVPLGNGQMCAGNGCTRPR